MSTPPESPANTGTTDDFDDARAQAARARDPSGGGVRYIEDPHELQGGHAVKLLRNGAETFPAWLAAIEAARARISLEMYIFSDDAIGRQFADALIGAAARGVEVRLLYDFVGCRDTPTEFFDRMRSRGVHVIVYHRYRFWRPRFWALLRRNHRKTLVCDGQIAFSGGLNIANDWVSVERRRGRLARRGRAGRRPGGRGHRGDLPAHLEPAREEVGARGSGARSRRRRRRARRRSR